MEQTPLHSAPPLTPAAGTSPNADASSGLLSALGAEELQRMQDTFAALGQVALCIWAPDGTPLTKPSGTGEFCRLLEANPSAPAACWESIVRAAQVGRESADAVVQVCHAGFRQHAAAVRVDGRHLATIVMGDRFTAQADPPFMAELSRRHGIDPAALRRAAEDLGLGDEARRQTVTQFLGLMADRLATICRQHAQMTQRVRELEALHGLMTLFAGSGHLKETLTATAERIGRVMEVKACSIRLLDEHTGELRIVAGYHLSAAYLNKGPVLLGSNPIDSAAFAGQVVYTRDVPSHPGTRYPEQTRAEGLVSGLCAPMTYRGRTIGVIRVYTGREQEFSDFQCALLRSIGSQVAAAILIYRLHQDRLSAEREHRQLRNAAAVQRRMMPGERRVHRNITFGGVYNPALNMGGDFFDFIDLPEGNLGFAIADVVGKGISAALMMASVRSALRAHAHSIYNLDEIVALVNAHLCRDTQISEFATLFYGVFAPDGRRLTYCNAGHPPGLLFREGEILELMTGDMLIGVDPRTRFSREMVDLLPGDVLVTYTDGVVEAIDFHDQAFGRERLAQSVCKYAELDALALAKQILWGVRRFVGLADQTDDITIVVAKVG